MNYYNETIAETSDKQIYYQIVKSADQKTGLKATNWIKAAKGSEEDGKTVYWIDFSGTANSKDAFFALTTDSTQGDADFVAEVNAVIKSVKATLNYKAEEAEEFNTLEWDMLKASNGTLYISIIGKYVAGNDTTDTVAFRMSKEAKVKIPKSAKAPTVKVDYVKGTLALKNGMQIRLVESKFDDGNPWMDVIAYKKDGADNGLFALATAEKTTSAKASKVAVADFAEAINKYLTKTEDENAEVTDDFVAGDELTLELRTAATEKKFPSMTGIMKLVLPAEAPAVKQAANGVTPEGEGAKQNIADLVYAKADKASNTTAAYTVKFSDLFTKADGKQYTDYEYVVVADPADGVNLEKQKWTKLTGESVDWAKNIGKMFTYYKADSTEKATVQYENIQAIYIRLAAVKGDKEKRVYLRVSMQRFM